MEGVDEGNISCCRGVDNFKSWWADVEWVQNLEVFFYLQPCNA